MSMNSKTLESRMIGNGHVRFGGGPREKGWKQYLASGLPYTTERYVRWHPSDHVSFAWLIDPATHGHVGAVHRVSEYLNGLPAKPAIFEIRWEDPGDVEAEYARVLLATARGQGELAGLEIRLMHEYEQMPGGTRMRSHFHLPPETPAALVNALYEHNRQEMAYLTSFLPTLYQKEASHEEIW